MKAYMFGPQEGKMNLDRVDLIDVSVAGTDVECLSQLLYEQLTKEDVLAYDRAPDGTHWFVCVFRDEDGEQTKPVYYGWRDDGSLGMMWCEPMPFVRWCNTAIRITMKAAADRLAALVDYAETLDMGPDDKEDFEWLEEFEVVASNACEEVFG